MPGRRLRRQPEFCFSRQVDCCSGASIAVPREAWNRVGGLNESFAPAYYEDADLAFQLRRLGFEIWFQPLSLVVHYEGRSHGRDVTGQIKAYETVNRETFYSRWRTVLTSHGAPGTSPIREWNRMKRHRILMIDVQTPTTDRDSGSITTYEVIRFFIVSGWRVSFAPRNLVFVGEYTTSLQRMGVEVLIQPYICGFDDILDTGAMYDVIFAFRVDALWDWYDLLRRGYPEARIIFHDVDLHYLRLERRAEVLSDRSLRIEAEVIHDRELELFAKVDCSVVTTQAEREIIQSQIPLDNVIVYPYTIDVRRTQRPYTDRRHLCFFGGYAHDPNVDAVIYFVRDIWPLVRPRLPSDAKFFIVGPDPSESLVRLACDDIVVTGHHPRLDDLLDDCRLSVVPLRYGAGIKGKLVKSLSSGLPSVATRIAVEGMSLVHEEHALVADDPQSFAEAVIRLYHEEALWRRIQEAGYRFVEENYSRERGRSICNLILETADRVWIERRRTARRRRLSELVDMASAATSSPQDSGRKALK
jgi:glycosyltransferase involved in cell wall biosynthesis